MPVTLNWTDTNSNEDGHRVYRSTATIDPAALPTPIADLGGNVTTYTDGDVTEGETYYYRVSAYRGASENVSEELVLTALPEADAYVASVGAYSNAPASVETRLLQVPPEAGVGDLLVAFVGMDYGSTDHLFTPPGWTLEVSNRDAGQIGVFTKVAEGSDLGGAVGFSVYQGNDSAGIMLALRGAAPLGVIGSATDDGSYGSPTWDVAPLTLTEGDVLVLAASFTEGLSGTGNTNSMSTGWTLASPATTDGLATLLVGWQKYTEAGYVTGQFDDGLTGGYDRELITLAIGRAP
jgi:hypothetical protein